MTRRGTAGLDMVLGTAGQGWVRHGAAVQGMAWFVEWHGVDAISVASIKIKNMVRGVVRGSAGRGQAGPGTARLGKA